uniref:Uncharacterized protein n=1 Tax=Knipowitschia caucasica TaxID=637954 RepID=A0AAV2MM62_KNICA
MGCIFRPREGGRGGGGYRNGTDMVLLIQIPMCQSGNNANALLRLGFPSCSWRRSRQSHGVMKASEQLQGGTSEQLRGGTSEQLQGGTSEQLQGGTSEQLRGGTSEQLQGGTS